MLMQRVITASILVLVLLSIILFLPPVYFQLFAGLLALISVWEWSRLAGLSNKAFRIVYVLLFIPLLWWIWKEQSIQEVMLWIGGVWWICATCLVLMYPQAKNLWSKPVLLSLAGFALLLPVWSALLVISFHPEWSYLLILLFLLVAASDIGAYFSGRAFGQHKLAPEVSPNKTWEGFWGGVLASSIVALLANLMLSSHDVELSTGILMFLIGALVAGMGVMGDLLESMMKRQAGFKDSGSILPGHGGVLDRIDSITAAAPAFALLLIYFERVLL